MATFKTRARAVDLLGKQSIRDEVTAISELLRNSYDADASEGLIDVDTHHNRIIVWDDGEGMSVKDLENHWLTLGTYSKKTNTPQPTKKNRIKIGEKGIGRLAISLLGDQLLLISKKRATDYAESQWSLLYLHWDLFRNERALLEDIDIPTHHFSSFSELTLFLKADFDELKKLLISNLNDRSVWDDETTERITNEVERFTVSKEMINQLKRIEKKGGGTAFFITNLDKSWDWDVYERQTEETDTLRRIQRLKDTLFSFSNFIDIFEKQNNESEKSPELEDVEIDHFKPRIRINGEYLDNRSHLNPDEMELFDYALKGEIINGLFSGVALIRNLDGSFESTRIEDKDLTQGIKDNRLKDCGPIKLKWYFLEGNASNSALDKAQHNLIDKKLDIVGGIYVYRDGLRILPYGEPGSDFLNLEEKRTRNARNLFSFRRMFGYMEISKLTNPDLQDKSSREGFIENGYFGYFRQVARTLLEFWAKELLETFKEGAGIRSKHLARMKAEREKEQYAIEKQRQEELNEREYFKDLESRINSFEETFTKKKVEVETTVQRILTSKPEWWSRINYNRESLKRKIFELTRQGHSEIAKLETYFIALNDRYQHDYSLVDRIEACNEGLARMKTEMTLKFENSLTALEHELEQIIAEFERKAMQDKDIKVVSLGIIKRLEDQINSVERGVPKLFMDVLEAQSTSVRAQMKSFEEDILSKIEAEINLRKKQLSPLHLELQNEVKLLKYILTQLRTGITSEHDLKKFAEETDQISTRVSTKMSELHRQVIGLEEKVRSSKAAQNAKQVFSEIQQILSGNRNSDDSLIGLLRKEIDLYRELSAVGLAAELTSHEFDSHYSSIRDNLSTLSKGLKNSPNALTYVTNTQKAFLSLERLHQRMSPLYRQTRHTRKNLKLKHFIEEALEYFSNDITGYEVNTFVDIPENIVVKETESILFTPLINLLSNAIYWIINQDKRELHFYMSKDMKCLYVHDSGLGIQEKDRARVFEPYFSKKINGRGLGLFLSRDLLESKGHKLYLIHPVEFDRDVAGACFCIEFKKNTVNEV